MKLFLRMLAYCVIGTAVGLGIGQWFIFVLELKLGTVLGYIVGLGPVLLLLCIFGCALQWRMQKHLENKP